MRPINWLQLVLLSILWGGSFYCVAVAVAELPPLTVVLARVGLAAIVMVILVHVAGDRLPTRLSDWKLLAGMGLLNNAIPFTVISWGQVHIDSGLASILNATTPFFTVLLAHVLTRDERITPAKLLGVLIGLAGVVALIGPATLSGLGVDGLAQGAVLGMLIASTVMLFPVTLMVDPSVTALPSMKTLAAIIFMAVFSTGLAYILYFRILRVAGATNVLLVTFLVPVSALTLGILILDEALTWSAMLGMALIFAGLAAVDGRIFKFVHIGTPRG
jgi:drug/metabolite transporter (DMT)-like permease